MSPIIPNLCKNSFNNPVRYWIPYRQSSLANRQLRTILIFCSKRFTRKNGYNKSLYSHFLYSFSCFVIKNRICSFFLRNSQETSVGFDFNIVRMFQVSNYVVIFPVMFFPRLFACVKKSE